MRQAVRESAVYAELPVLGGVGSLRATYQTHAFAPHAHDTFVIGVFERGNALIRCEQVERRASVGDVLVIAPGAVHSAWSPRGAEWRYRAVYPRGDAIAAAIGVAVAEDAGFADHVVADRRAASALVSALRAIDAHRSPLAIEELLVTALRQLWSRTTRSGRAVGVQPACSRALRLAREMIDANVVGVISLGDVAEAVGLSRYHLIRSFAARYGLTPYAYYTQRRVAEARRLLAAGTEPARVAAACGFADQSHMTRQFKRVYGVTPGAFVAGL